MDIDIEKEISIFMMSTFNQLSNAAFAALGVKCESVYSHVTRSNHLVCEQGEEERVQKYAADLKSINMLSTALLTDSLRISLEGLQSLSPDSLHGAAEEARRIVKKIQKDEDIDLSALRKCQ